MRSFHLLRHPAAGVRTASWRHLLVVAAAGALLLTFGPTVSPSGASVGVTSTWVVTDLNGAGSLLAQLEVASVGGQLLQSLGVANSVEASLTSAQVSALQLLPGIVVSPNVSVSLESTSIPTPTSPITPPNGPPPGSTSSGAHTPSDAFTTQSGAPQLWASGDTGQGINVAVLDTGISALPDFGKRLVGGVDLTGEGNPFEDDYGHGTFVAGLIAGDGAGSGGKYEGEAPGAGLVSVKVAGANGQTNLATVIEGVGWTVANAAALHIRVLNMSLGFVPFSSVYLNPLDLAVQSAWNAGIVVVVSAGNAGPFSGTILSPGDDPDVITVGAVDDLAQGNVAGDSMPSFSSVGPTDPDGIYKPDLVSSGRSVVSLADPGSTIYTQNPSARVGTANFVGSGTSFSAAITSGAVALDLEQHPNYSPNQAKAQLLGSTNPGPTGNPFVDGHGVLNVAAAVKDTSETLAQPYGSVLVAGSMEGNLRIEPGDTLEAGYAFTMPGSHPAAVVQFALPSVSIPLSCSSGGAYVGTATISLTGGPYIELLNGTAALPTSAQSSPASYQGSTTAPNLCKGAAMYGASAALSSEVISTDAVDHVDVAFHYADPQRLASAAWSSPGVATPIDPISISSSVSLAVPWAQSSWNPANWGGLPSIAVTGSAPPASGLQWNGTAWNGTAWNGTAWSGTAWNGTAWNGTAWNGTAWNGTAWNGTAWNGTAWNGTAWNGSAWN
jgi:serine protease AprX